MPGSRLQEVGAKVELYVKNAGERLSKDFKMELDEMRKQSGKMTEALTELNGLRNDKGEEILEGTVSKIKGSVEAIRVDLAARAILEAARHTELMAASAAAVAATATAQAAWDAEHGLLSIRVKTLEEQQRRMFRMIMTSFATTWKWACSFGENWKKLMAVAVAFGAAWALGAALVNRGQIVVVRTITAVQSEFRKEMK